MRVFIIILIIQIITPDVLKKVAMLFRHGARYPINNYYDGKDQKINWG